MHKNVKIKIKSWRKNILKNFYDSTLLIHWDGDFVWLNKLKRSTLDKNIGTLILNKEKGLSRVQSKVDKTSIYLIYDTEYTLHIVYNNIKNI